MSKVKRRLDLQRLQRVKIMYRTKTFSISLQARVLALCLAFCVGTTCSKEGISKTNSIETSYELKLSKRPGNAPKVSDRVPHQQLDQNSPASILQELKTFLFALEHVEEKNSGASLPSARGAYITPNKNVKSGVNREFTHIHIEPGPGSQHLTLTEKDFQLVNENGWGIKHPWSDRLTQDGLVLMMIYAPRNQTDLEQIKKIIRAAYQLALAEN